MACSFRLTGPTARAAEPCLLRSLNCESTRRSRRRVQIGKRHVHNRASTDDEGPPKRNSELELTIRRKAKEVGERLEALGEEGLETRLATAQPSPSPHLLVRRVAVLAERGCPAILVEVGRPHGDSGPQDVANLGVTVLQAGAHGLAVRTSSEDSPDGLSDLTAVTRAVSGRPELREAPVLMRDWLIHPIQLIDALDSGCAGVLGLVCQVSGAKGTKTMSMFGTALGLDIPIEVVNAAEVDELAEAGVALFAMNTSIGLSVSLPGFRESVMAGLIEALPFGCLSLAGVRTVAEARHARASGADGVVVRFEALEGLSPDEVRALLSDLEYAMAGDD